MDEDDDDDDEFVGDNMLRYGDGTDEDDED